MGHYMSFLDFHNLSPWREQFETDSFAAIMQRTADEAARARRNPLLRVDMCNRARCGCSTQAYGEGKHLAVSADPNDFVSHASFCCLGS